MFDTFDGNLQLDGETLSLFKPGVAPEPDLVVDRVRYESNAPWPDAPVLQPGTSLQLVDAAQDNSRVANWATGQAPATAPGTPGATNSICATLPEFPTLWLNEVQAQNLTGPSDNFGEREPWVELYNPGADAVSLDGFYLGTNYSSPAQWAFPSTSSIAPGQFIVVWLDGQPAQNSGSIVHAGFRLNPDAGSLALSRYVNGQPQIIDYLNFQSLPPNQSYGDVPDGQPFYRQTMFHITPAATNNSGFAPIAVSINEWMAENQGGLLNPATGKYETGSSYTTPPIHRRIFPDIICPIHSPTRSRTRSPSDSRCPHTGFYWYGPMTKDRRTQMATLSTFPSSSRRAAKQSDCSPRWDWRSTRSCLERNRRM